MINFKSVTLKNFLSFGTQPTTVQLDTNNVTLIMGENKDVGSSGYSRNGVGKSTIFQAVVWCLFNEGITNIKQDAFINIRNKKNMFVELTLEVNGIELVIKRGRKPNICEITKNGEPYTLHSVTNNDDAIRELLGMDIDVFMNTVLLTTNINSFMNMKPAEQRNFMERLLALHILSKRANKLKADNKDLEVDIKLEEQNRLNVEANASKAMENIKTLQSKSSSWEEENNYEIEGYIKEIKELESIDIEEHRTRNAEKAEIEKELDKVNDKLSSIEKDKNSEITLLKTELDKDILENDVTLSNNKANLLKEIAELRDKILAEKTKDQEKLYELKELESKKMLETDKLVKELREIATSNTDLAEELKALDSSICYNCRQPFFDKERKEEVRELIKSNDTRTEEIAKTAKELIKEEDDLHMEIAKADDAIKVNYQKLLNELDNNKTLKIDHLVEDNNKANLKLAEKCAEKIEKVEQKYAEMETVYKDKIELLKSGLPEIEYTISDCDRILMTISNNKDKIQKIKEAKNPYHDQIELIKKDIVEYDPTVLNNIKIVSDHHKILVKLLTDSKSFIRKNLVDQYVPFINTKINNYLEQLESPHKVKINPDLTVNIDYMRQDISFGNLSNGEKLRVNLATSFAFRELLSLSGSKTNLLLIDELLDNGGDSSFFYNVFKVLKNKENESIFIISHREELIPEVDSLITITKEAGFSSI